MSGVEDVENQRKSYKKPHNARNPIPTIKGYREEKEKRQEQYGQPDQSASDGAGEGSRRDRISEAYDVFKHGKDTGEFSNRDGPYMATNKNLVQDEEEAEDHAGRSQPTKDDKPLPEDQDSQDGMEDTTEGNLQSSDPKKARKAMKKFTADGTEREVTDPITHLPVKIHDFTNTDLKSTAKNPPPVGSEPKTMTGMDGIDKSDEHLDEEEQESKDAHKAMEVLFPPPDFDATRSEITAVYMQAVTVGLGVVAVSLMVVDTIFWSTRHSTGWTRQLFKVAELSTMLGVSAAIILFMRQWSENRIKNVWDVEVWQAERKRGQKLAKSQTAESAQWLNSLFASVWPLINPDLFTSIADTLEDVMQASLPSMVRMVAVEDLGQGSEALRILGVRWLPTGAAARSVSADGKLKSPHEEKGDRKVQDDGEGQSEEPGHDTMEAEEGDFVNVEIAFAYRPSTGRGIKSRAKHAHLYLAFYLPGKVKLPVWVELTGMVGVMRLRLQLCPDPPFFSICTMSFLGQPKVTLSCVPLIKKGPNLMDVPLISSFVQSSMDAALAEYVAPKSLTLDLKDMMMGDDFKKDTIAQGILFVRIKYAFDFKEGDAGFGPLSKGSADPYVTVGWAKFGKPVWSTRVLQDNMEPHWDETCFVCVTPAELNVDERLRIQLWDSDRTTADDDLGRIELDLKELMKGEETNNKMHDREDGFRALKAGEGMPGKLSWSIGYFSKTRITEDQFRAQKEDPDINSMDQLKKKVYKESEHKLREASVDHQHEVEQQKAEDFKNRQDELIIASPPSDDYPSGILSIQIHQITGLELEVLNKNKASSAEASDEDEEGDDLPSSYCTIILNHKKVFKTRTKPKNSKPFFNAGCERFIRDVRNTEVHISVRDARVHEDDPLLGIIYLPLERLFKKRSQINSVFPIAGGVGYGRARVSLVFRSVQVQLPRNMLGWDYGTLDIKSKVRGIDVPKDLRSLRMKIHTGSSRGKLHSRARTGTVREEDGQPIWTTKGDKNIRLPVRQRYSAPMVIEFRQDAALRDHTPAFGIFWLKELPDNDEQTVRVPIWKGDLKRAQENILDTYGEKVGEIQITLTFWSGLSGYHEKLAKKEQDLRQVMEVLDVCNDQEWSDWDDSDEAEKPGIETNESNDDNGSSSSSESDSENSDHGSKIVPDFLQKDKKRESNLSEDGKRGTMDMMREYKASAKQLHRKNRGVMQWKGPRTLAWMKHVGDRGKAKVGGIFHHHERSGAGIETEA
ncbi:Nn.00g099160.m01.CDS01 [Neocucurbitaria sp. VM-36]